MNRTFDAEFINALINHPEIRPHVGGDPSEPLDLSDAVANHDNIFLQGEHGGFACIWSAPDTYEVHTFVLPEGRGPWAAEFAQLGRDAMADMYGADHLWTMVHPEAAHVRAFALRAGMKPAGSRTIDLGAGSVTYDIFNWRRECL